MRPHRHPQPSACPATRRPPPCCSSDRDRSPVQPPPRSAQPSPAMGRRPRVSASTACAPRAGGTRSRCRPREDRSPSSRNIMAPHPRPGAGGGARGRPRAAPRAGAPTGRELQEFNRAPTRARQQEPGDGVRDVRVEEGPGAPRPPRARRLEGGPPPRGEVATRHHGRIGEHRRPPQGPEPRGLLEAEPDSSRSTI